MFEHRASSVRRVAGIFVLASLVSLSTAAAQGVGRTDHGNGQGSGHVKHHDRSNPKAKPSRAQGAAEGAAAQASVAAARSHGRRIGLALGRHQLTGVHGQALPARAQERILAVAARRSGRTELAAALAPASNAGAGRQADALARSLEGLLEDPSRLPAAASAYNRFIRASSDAYLAAPPAELLAIQAVLAPLAETAVHRASAPSVASR